MKKMFKKALAAILVLTMILSFAPMCFAAEESEVMTECGGECEYAPSIVIPGLFQSDNRMYDENGNEMLDANGRPLRQLFLNVTAGDIVKIVFKAIVPFVLSLVLQHDIGLSKTVASVVADIFGGNATGNDGKHINNIDVIRYPSSLATCTEEEKKTVYNTVPIEDYANIAGEDHLYFFTYDSFGSISAIADELYQFIQTVKKETGHDKVNIVPISQAGSISNALIGRYTEEMARDLNRIVYIIPALDGSWLITKIFNGKFIKEDEMLYKNLFPSIFGENEQGLAYFVNVALRLLSKDMAYAIIDETVQALVDTLLVNCTCIWGLVSESDYQELYDKYLKGGEREAVRKEVEFYHESRVNLKQNLTTLKEAGVEIFDIIDYDYKFYPLFPGWDEVNADGIIQLDSTSFGATSAPVGEALPEDYVEAGTYCTCTDGHSHMSPERTVDASTGFLCETSFYFRGQDHEGTGRNDVIMRLAIDLLTDENFKSVHTYPDKYPQFNVGRESKGLRNNELPAAKKVDLSTLSEEDAAELQAAIAECEAVLEETVVDIEKYYAAEERLNNILIKIGVRGAPVPPSESSVKLTNFLQKVSDWVYENVGPRGFSDVFRFKHREW
ncbi:MAG: hypothetical protein IJB86_07535 [Clostridia bacterium]|nr:hypothetical protein [Clostridia bacterium]